jgi:hypothetical protein
MRVVRQLSHQRSPMAMDIYQWLTYRQHRLLVSGQPRVVIPWHSLAGQFGAGYRRIRDFRSSFVEALRIVLVVYPGGGAPRRNLACSSLLGDRTLPTSLVARPSAIERFQAPRSGVDEAARDLWRSDRDDAVQRIEHVARRVAGVDLGAVQRSLGHSSPEITAAVYDHSDLEDYRADVERALTFAPAAHTGNASRRICERRSPRRARSSE